MFIETVSAVFLTMILFVKLHSGCRWFAEIDEARNATISHRLVDMEDYSQYYYKIKSEWGQQIAAVSFYYNSCSAGV